MKAVMPAEDIKILIHQSIEVEQFPILNRLAEVEDILDQLPKGMADEKLEQTVADLEQQVRDLYDEPAALKENEIKGLID